MFFAKATLRKKEGETCSTRRKVTCGRIKRVWAKRWLPDRENTQANLLKDFRDVHTNLFWILKPSLVPHFAFIH
jgi:hypothetical protein